MPRLRDNLEAVVNRKLFRGRGCSNGCVSPVVADQATGVAGSQGGSRGSMYFGSGLSGSGLRCVLSSNLKFCLQRQPLRPLICIFCLYFERLSISYFTEGSPPSSDKLGCLWRVGS